jgi:hypothetical protein
MCLLTACLRLLMTIKWKKWKFVFFAFFNIFVHYHLIQEKVNILERRLVDKDIDGGFDKSAPHSARYHNMGPAEAGKSRLENVKKSNQNHL